MNNYGMDIRVDIIIMFNIRFNQPPLTQFNVEFLIRILK